MPGLNRSARHGPGGLWRREVQIVPGLWIGAHPLQSGNADADPIDLDASPLSPASSAVGRAVKPGEPSPRPCVVAQCCFATQWRRPHAHDRNGGKRCDAWPRQPEAPQEGPVTS